jgi:hypothetical protein
VTPAKTECEVSLENLDDTPTKLTAMPPHPDKVETHCGLVLPAGLRRVAEPRDDRRVASRERLLRIFTRLASALRS